MLLPAQPVTLTPEQIAELNKKLSTMRHDINNSLALVLALGPPSRSTGWSRTVLTFFTRTVVAPPSRTRTQSIPRSRDAGRSAARAVESN